MNQRGGVRNTKSGDKMQQNLWQNLKSLLIWGECRKRERKSKQCGIKIPNDLYLGGSRGKGEK